jgi:hypothetical protein
MARSLKKVRFVAYHLLKKLIKIDKQIKDTITGPRSSSTILHLEYDWILVQFTTVNMYQFLFLINWLDIKLG